jgi:hypothetical protein
MSAPTLHRPPTTSRPTPPTRSRRPRMLLIAASLVVVAAAAGTSLALTNRSSTDTPAAPVASDPITAGQPTDQLAGQAGDQRGTGDQSSQSGQSGGAAKAGDDAKAKDDSGSRGTGSGSADTAKGAAVLANGVHHAHIRKVDVAGGRLTVDVVQAFFDGDAVKAAIADGKSREEAKYLPVWLRNESSRLRTLPVAAGFKVAFLNPCDEPSGQGATLQRLAANARSGVYFYSLTVRDGAVQSVRERLAVNAC